MVRQVDADATARGQREFGNTFMRMTQEKGFTSL